MANGLSMKVLLQLQKQGFDKGIAQVKNSITSLGRSIKSVAGMIVGGLGLSALVGQFKDTAQQLSVVKATMENVSNGFKEYSENMEFIKRISKEYGQDMISLTNGFAKFHAAAKQTNLSLDQQRDIFESLTRAAGAYHLSADQTSNVMLAVEQMLSKGKVAAEELRRQLGNSLPGAFNLMAVAAGMAGVTVNGTTAELEAAMKAGKVMSEQVLPHFVQVLNATTQVANFDSLQSSLNRFKNAWADFVDNSGFEGAFKGLVDFGTRALGTLSEHTNAFKRTLLSGLGGALAWIGANGFKKLQAEGEKNLSPLVRYVRGISNELDNTKSAIKEVDNQLNVLSNSTESVHTSFIGADDIKYMKNLNKEQEKLLKNLTAGGHKIEIEEDKWEAITRLSERRNDLEQKRVGLLSQLNQIEGDSVDQIKKTNLAWEGLKATGTAFLNVLKGVALNMAAAFAVSLIVNWISKIVQAANEAKRLKNMVADTQAEAEKAASVVNEQIARMNALYKIVKDTGSSEELRQRALKEINRLLGTQKFTLDDIKTNSDKVKASIDKWKDGLINAARAAAYFSKIQELEAKKIELETKRNEELAKPQTKTVAYGNGYSKWEEPTKAAENVAKYTKEINALDASINNLFDTMKNKGLSNPFEGPDSDDIDSAKAIKTALDNYKNSLAELDKKLKNGSVSTKKYNRDVNKLREDTLKTIQKYDDWEDVVEDLGGEYEKLAGQLQKTSNYTTKTPINQLKEDLQKFKKEKDKLDSTLDSGKMSGEEYAEALEKLVNRFKDNIFGFDDLEEKLNKLGPKFKEIVDEMNESISNINLWNEIDEAIKAQDKALEKTMNESLAKIEKYYEQAANIMADGIPQKRKKETNFFAYKDGLAATLAGNAKDAEDYVKALQKVRDRILALKKLNGLDPAMQSMLDEVIEKLRIAKNEAGALRDAAYFAELSQDIKELKKQLEADSWEVWSQGIVGGLSRITSAFQSLNEALGGGVFDEDLLEGASALLQVFESLNEVVETVNNTFQMFNSIIETTNRLQQAQTAMTELMTGAKVQGLAAETIAEQTSAAATQSAEAAKTTAINTTTAALAAQSVAGAASSQASIPYVGPILAAAAVAGMVALLAANMNKFANGGIVGGSKTQGDKQMVRVNSSEMILNKAQQANLWSIINGRGGTGGQVEFKIKGADLVGTINNYNSRKRG